MTPIINTNGKWQLIGTEDERTGVVFRQTRNNVGYLQFGTPAGGPSWQQEIHAFKDGKRIEKFNVLEVEGEIEECSLNGKAISKEAGRAYLNKVPQGQDITAYFRDMETKE